MKTDGKISTAKGAKSAEKSLKKSFALFVCFAVKFSWSSVSVDMWPVLKIETRMQETRILAGQGNDPRHQNPRLYPFSSFVVPKAWCLMGKKLTTKARSSRRNV